MHALTMVARACRLLSRTDALPAFPCGNDLLLQYRITSSFVKGPGRKADKSLRGGLLLIPVRIYVEYREDYPVTLALIGINILAFVPLLLTSCCGLQPFFAKYGLVPGSPQPHQFLTHMFLHGGVFHLGFNMLFLWLFGKVVESIFGHARFVLFYFGGGLVAALSQLAICHVSGAGLEVPMVGASGAIAAVLGVFLVRYYFVKIEMRWFFFFFLFFRIYTFHLRAWVFLLLLWFVPQLAFGLLSFGYSSGVAYWAHIGGFLFGVILGMQMNLLREAKAELAYGKARDPSAVGDGTSRMHLKESINASPHNVKARLELAQSYIREQRLDDAIREYVEAFNDAYRAGEVEEALSVYSMVFALKDEELILPENQEFRLGLDCIKYAHYELAFQILEKLHRLRPDHPQTEQILARLVALSANKLVKYPEAEEYLEQLRKGYPHSRYIETLEWDLSRIKDRTAVPTA
jgi:membrane associated rhomboid family serine protease